MGGIWYYFGMTLEMKVRLFPGGPEFPAEFLDLIQSGQVVFFCGAGLSVGTGLPTFSGLVRELDKILNPDSNDRFDDGRTDYDRMLSELESRFVPKRMRKHVCRILSEPPKSGTLENHQNILKLAATPGGGFRLITTNFDDRFSLANGKKIPSDDAPKLPVPESAGWSSLVHLHGRICEEGDLNNLVLNASDFGRAYLSEGWARRFVVRLMRCWPVAFVGYGLNDPPMRYLMDAVYDPRTSAEEFCQAFALVGCKAGEESKQRQEWEGKRVTPILYNNAEKHKVLGEILGNLVRLKDESDYRANLAIQGVDKNPDDEDGDNGRRVIWALRDPIAAVDFSEKKIFTNMKDEGRFIRWLDAIKTSGLFRVNSAMVAKATIDPLFSSTCVPLSPVAEHLAYWVARHVHQPALLWWLASENMSLYPWFVKLLAHYVVNGARSENKMPASLVQKWQLFIQEKSAPPPSETLFPSWAMESKQSDWINSNLERHILSALRPQVRIVRERRFALSHETHEPFRADVTVDCNMERLNIMTEIKEWIKRSNFIVQYAEVLSAHLEDAVSLAEDCGIGTSWEPYCFHPNEDHGSEHSYLGFLARLVRDAVLRMIEAEDVSRLKCLVSRWMSGKHVLLRRLALYSITEMVKLPNDKRLPADWGVKILMTPPDALWSSEFQSESLRFLRKAGADITPSMRAELESVIRKGPSRSVYRADLPAKEVADAMRHQIIVRLAKLKISLQQSEEKLSPESDHMLTNAHNAHPEEKFEDAMEPIFKISGFQAMPIERGIDLKWGEVASDECANRIQSGEWLNIGTLVSGHPDKAVDVFEALANREFWNCDKWAPFLIGFGGDKNISDGLAPRLIRMLEAMPDELARPCVRDYASLLQVISRTRPFSEIQAAWRKAWNFDLDARSILANAPGDDLSTMSIINHAHGMLTIAALTRFGQEEKQENLLDLYAEILTSEKPSHKHGKVIIGGNLSLLFHSHRKWTQQNLLPFFKSKHPMAFSMWDEFLRNPGWSVELLAALKPDLMCFIERADDLHRANNLVEIFIIGGMQHPEIIHQEEQRRGIAGMSPNGIRHLCWCMERELQDDDGAALAETWRERIFPFLRDVWPEKRRTAGESSDVSQALASLIMSTGDAFPGAFRWAEDFLSPIVTQGRWKHPVTDFLYGRQGLEKSIPTKFPRECLFFLHQIVPDEAIPLHRRNQLNTLLDKIREVDPDLEKRPEFIRLRKIASGG